MAPLSLASGATGPWRPPLSPIWGPETIVVDLGLEIPYPAPLPQVAQQTEDHALVERYLDNILPGVSLASLSESYADDIFAAGADDNDDTTGGVLGGDKGDEALGGAGGEGGGDEANPAPPKPRRGRPPKAAADTAVAADPSLGLGDSYV
jgi:hypothetical protein